MVGDMDVESKEMKSARRLAPIFVMKKRYMAIYMLRRLIGPLMISDSHTPPQAEAYMSYMPSLHEKVSCEGTRSP